MGGVKNSKKNGFNYYILVFHAEFDSVKNSAVEVRVHYENLKIKGILF